MGAMLVASTVRSSLMARWLQVALHAAEQQAKHGQSVSVPSLSALIKHDAVAHAIATQSK